MNPKLFVLLENVRSTYNVGSIFRTCEAAGVDKLYLTGYTAYPPDPKLNKTALASTQNIKWEHQENPLGMVKKLKSQNVKIAILESDKKAKSIYHSQFTSKICLIFGNEIEGVSPDLIKAGDYLMQIPQFGKKESLNVSVAVGIAVYEFVRKRT